jgi:hypothetical protein
MFFTIDLKRLRATRQGSALFVDLLMVFLVILNLGFIFFDWSFSYHSFETMVGWISSDFRDWYATQVHPRASFIDLVFVSIFLTELTIRWLIAIRRRTYEKWFFYPFVHWYDVLGCIPMNGTFKLFRLLRIIGMISRLHNLGIIDIKSTYLYKKSRKYINILVEEISDQVVINVLNGVQTEVKKGNPVVQKIANDVLIPRQDDINIWVSNRVSEAVTATYFKHRMELYEYLKDLITRSVQENQEIKRIALIPGVGKLITEILDSSISNITFNVIDNSMEDLSKGKSLTAIQDITDSILDNLTHEHPENAKINQMMTEVVDQTIEVVKHQVAIKQWKINELEERKAKLIKRIAEGRGSVSAAQAEIDIINEQLQEMA